MGGYVASLEKWGSFADEWQAILEEQPRIPVPKIKNYQFLPKVRLRKFVSAINRHVSFPVLCAISVNGYEKEMKGQHLPPRMDNPYHWCFYNILTSVLTTMKKRGIRDRVDFIFDENSIFADRVMEAYRHFQRVLTGVETRLLGSPPIFRDDGNFLPLQAADMLVWHINRKLTGKTYPVLLDEVEMSPARDVWTAERLAMGREVSKHALQLIQSEAERGQERMTSLRPIVGKRWKG